MKLLSVLKASSVLLTASMLTSCVGSPVAVATTEPVCQKIKPISFALKPKGSLETAANDFDTDETALAVDAHNRKLEALCGE